VTLQVRTGSPAAGRLDADAAYRAGAIAVRQNRPEEAVPLMQAAVAAHPNDARLWQILGLAHRKLEDLAPAVQALTEAARLAPRDPLVAHTLARATLEAGLPAVPLFERASALAPGDSGVWLGHAAALFAENRTDAAIALVDAQLADHPGWLLGHVTAARLRWMRGDGEGFTVSLERALAAQPRSLDLWRQLASTLVEGRLHDAAKVAIGRAREAAGGSPLLDALEAAALAEQGETAAADRLFARLPKPLDVATAEFWVRHLLRSGRSAEAAAAAEPRARAPGGEAFWPYLASAWRLIGDSRWEWLEGDERFVGIYDISDKVGSLDALAGCLRRIHLATHQPLEQSLRGGTQTDGPLFARIEPEIRALRAAILDAVKAHIAALPTPDQSHPLLGVPRAPVRFSGSWSVRLTDGGHHANHVHPAGWISSAFYVALPEEMGGEDRAGWLTLGEATEVGVDLPPFRIIEPKPGRLVLFPSTMWHGTRPFGAGERLTVAFDVARPN
jgi:tetratricopeptide (TPR) repeat protein